MPYFTAERTCAGPASEANFGNMLAGDGPFTQRCHGWLEARTGSSKALLTHSCTAALEMAALLLDIQPGDEIIMPSYTFVSTANAFVLRGGVPVFVDIRADTLNLDEQLIESAITPRTKMIVLNSQIGVHIDKLRPWADWNTSGTIKHRPVQYSSDDFWDKLVSAGIDPVRQLGIAARKAPPESFLAEFNSKDD